MAPKPFDPTNHDFYIEDLLLLKEEISKFVQERNEAEKAYCEGELDDAGLASSEIEAGTRLKERLWAIAISCGLHSDFLSDFVSQAKSNGLMALS